LDEERGVGGRGESRMAYRAVVDTAESISSSPIIRSPPGRRSGSPLHATMQLQQALNGHYSNWQESQREKVQAFVTEALESGMESMHEPPRWSQQSVRFLSEDDDVPRPSWYPHEAAVEEIQQMIVECLAARGLSDGYKLEHAERDFAKGYRSFVSFRLCCDETRSVERWRKQMGDRARTYVDEALRMMVDAAQKGNAQVWAKIPSGRYSNFLTKDEAWPTWLGRERAVQEIQMIVRATMDTHGCDQGFRLETQGGPMSGTWFRVSYDIPKPVTAARGGRKTSGYVSSRPASTSHPRNRPSARASSGSGFK